MTTCRIAALVMARDEWPLLGLSVTHVLENHADEVWVLDHASRDGTQQHLATMQEHWPGRLHVLRLESDAYWQEAAMSVLLTASRHAVPDWVYFFDADEFAITPGSSIREIMELAPHDVEAVRYQVRNWASLTDFDEDDLDQYSRLKYRTIPNARIPFPGRVLAHEITMGHINYFDVPFEPKLIVRGGTTSWMYAGAHDVRFPEGPRVIDVAPEQLATAHLPLLSRRRLELRAKHGEELVNRGFSLDHGWQSQMICSIRAQGWLDEFWESHSVGTSGMSPYGTMPVWVEDPSLGAALSEARAALLGAVGNGAADSGGLGGRASNGTSLPLKDVVEVVRQIQVAGDAFRLQRDRLDVDAGALGIQLRTVVDEKAGLEAALAVAADQLHLAEADLEAASDQLRLADVELSRLRLESRDLAHRFAAVTGSRRFRFVSGLARPIDRLRGR